MQVLMWQLNSSCHTKIAASSSTRAISLCSSKTYQKVGRGNNPAGSSNQSIQWGRKFRRSWGMQSESFFGLSAGHGLRPLKGCGKEELLSGGTAVGWAPQQTQSLQAHLIPGTWFLPSSLKNKVLQSRKQGEEAGWFLMCLFPIPEVCQGSAQLCDGFFIPPRRRDQGEKEKADWMRVKNFKMT